MLKFSASGADSAAKNKNVFSFKFLLTIDLLLFLFVMNFYNDLTKVFIEFFGSKYSDFKCLPRISPNSAAS